MVLPMWSVPGGGEGDPGKLGVSDLEDAYLQSIDIA